MMAETRDENLQRRVDRLEWEVSTIASAQAAQEERMTELKAQIGVQHNQVMKAIGGLKDDWSKHRGAAEAKDEYRRFLLKAIGIAIAGGGLIIAAASLSSDASADLFVAPKPGVSAPVFSQCNGLVES